MCVQRDICRGRSELKQIIHESMLHVVGQAQYVEGVFQGIVGVDAYEATWSGRSRGGEEGQDKRVRSQRDKKVLQEERERESATQTGNQPW